MKYRYKGPAGKHSLADGETAVAGESYEIDDSTAASNRDRWDAAPEQQEPTIRRRRTPGAVEHTDSSAESTEG